MIYPLVRDLAAEDVPVAVTCRVLKFSKQNYFKWLRRPCSRRDLENAYLTDAAVDVNHDDPEFGYRFIADELERLGHKVSENRVWRLCSEQRIFSAHSKKRGLSRRPGPPVHDDLVERDFSASRPNELWLTDITEHQTREGKLYCCGVKDVFSNRIVGYATDSRMTASLAVRALHHAVALRGPGATVVHSDRGSQFRAHVYVRALRDFGLRGSMGRVAAAGDNAPMESFYSLLQKNVLNSRKQWATREELHLAIVRWIEVTYNRRRRQRALGKLTPIEYETIYTAEMVA
jgi:putative transposase